MYADDTTIIGEVSHIAQVQPILHDVYKQLKDYYDINHLILNESKSEILIADGSNMSSNFIFGNSILCSSISVKILGIDLDSKLNFNVQVNTTIACINKSIPFLYNI
jgi:hypothetical protein